MWHRGVMSAEQAIRRLRHLRGVVGCTLQNGQWYCGSCLRFMATSGKATIGDVSIGLSIPKSPELVPIKYISENTPQSILKHLRWIMQKDLLGQDVFLIGPPGPLRREIAMMYLELTKREVEYVSLSRDTTETDLKQRREIRAGTAFHLDQCAVNAALEGRVLILEGIEKAERNVLPVLNNLLENREMQLDDGRFLVAAERYDKLLQDHTKDELDELKMVRVNEKFRVIALGLPIPRFQGNPLDPPLRSRFQARDVHPLPFKEQLDNLRDSGSSVQADRLSQVLSFASTMLTTESSSMGLPHFPMDNLQAIIRILNILPKTSSLSLIHRLYPHDVMLGKDGRTAVEDTLQKFELGSQDASPGVIAGLSKGDNHAMVTFDQDGKSFQAEVIAGLLPARVEDTGAFICTPYHDQVLCEMMQSHLVKDFCLIGPRGCGKTVLVKQFADMLGYHVEPIMLYQDMTARDLLQQRTTSLTGDTSWRPSPLVTAALEGSLAILDGVHRINPGSFAVLHRLVHDRELQLFDGTRLIRHDRYEAIKEASSLTDEQMKKKNIFPVHPSFRIIALSEPPVVGSSKQQWLSPEMLTMFLYHNMRSLSRLEEGDVIQKMVAGVPDVGKLFDFVHKLRSSGDSTLHSLSSSLSTRQLLRVAKRLAAFPSEDLYGIVQKASLARFLPRIARNALEQVLTECDILQQEQSHNLDNIEQSVTCEVKNGMLRIGSTEVPTYNPENRTKVPDILFYENAQHLMVMEDMLKDYTLGEHLLLVGNQGVGKNKIVDKFLSLLNRPREYLQLHRDTTVQTLTLQPTVQDGVIVYEDSPLVRAVKFGHVLVVDEADKAPTHVTCILKTLVESGEMHLADGRRIVSCTSGVAASDRIIVAHPDFRMFVLANRPGFPFLGNDFFGAMGDIFSAHAIDNPNMESEMAMLRQYGPNVPEATLMKLVVAFGELRDMADQGLISYPYSTREVVNMVRHIQKYPHEGLTSVVKNVFDFDSYNKELQETIIQTMEKHGIPLGATQAKVELAKEFPLPKFELAGQWRVATHSGSQKSGLLSCPVEVRTLGTKGPVPLIIQAVPLERTESRSSTFSEQEAFWRLPLTEGNVVCDVAVTKANQRSPHHGGRHDVIHVVTTNPICMYSMNTQALTANCIDLYDVFPTTSGAYRPRVRLSPLSAPLDDSVMLHEEVTNVVLSVNVETGEITRMISSTMPETPVEKRRFPSHTPNRSHAFKMVPYSGEDPYGRTSFFKVNGGSLEIFNLLEGISISVSLPINIQSAQRVALNKWLLTETESNRKYVLEMQNKEEFVLHPIEETTEHNPVTFAAHVPLGDLTLKKTLKQHITSPNRVIVSPNSYADVLVGFPDLSTADVYSIPREPIEDQPSNNKADPIMGFLSRPVVNPGTGQVVSYLPESGQVIRALPPEKVPKEVYPNGVKPVNSSGYLEVSDIANHKLRYIPVPGSAKVSPYASWLFGPADVAITMATMSNDGLVTVDAGGCVRLWETSLMHLERSLQEWRNMIGYEDSKPLQMSQDKETDKEATGPKHGQTDPLNAPHVGGNMWAGGTGGANTAGMGGIGGPYRLDAGNDVYQVPQAAIDNVPEEVRQAAREMAQKAFKERLREIQMSEFDADTYESFAQNVRRQVKSLRVILESLQAKGKERQWLKHQTYGDLDEAKLIEGITGEKSIYKRRGDREPELGTPQELPKRLRLVVDLSGSMYRFNGHDRRLEREMETVLMVMEAFEKFEDKFKYDIYGHSGEDYSCEIVHCDKPPTNDKERLIVLKTMHAHSQFCLSGDNTLEATKHAIEKLVQEDADEHFVIILSDANFERYGIRPSKFADLLTADEDVNAYAIFIGSLGDQATRLTKQLPSGRAFVCMDTNKLPQILQQIFTSTMLSS